MNYTDCKVISTLKESKVPLVSAVKTDNFTEAISKNFDYEFNGCYDIKGYKNSTALIMSAIIPGAGQMSKRRYGEGVITLLSEMCLATGAFVVYNVADSRLAVMKEEGNIERLNLYNTLKTVNYACLGSAAALYAFNLYRAYTAKPRYSRNLAFIPTAVPVGYDMAYGVSLTYSF